MIEIRYTPMMTCHDDGAAACAAVTKVFVGVCRDKHLRLIWSEESAPLEVDEEEAGAAIERARLSIGTGADRP